MNHFELFDLPVSFTPDQQLVSQRYFELQRKYHPDFYANATDSEKEETLEISSMANNAYKTFINKDATMKYVLQLKEVLQEEEKYNLPPDFLMEVMELNELQMDGADEKVIEEGVTRLEKEISTGVQPLIDHYQDGITPEADLLLIKEYYFKRKYLARIREKGETL